MKKKMKVGIAVLLCLAFLLGSAVTQLVIGLYPANVTTVWVNNPPLHEATYIIGVYNSTHYYAKNGTTGEIEFCGTDASQIIQQAGKNGGELIFKSGTYTVTTTIAFTGKGTNFGLTIKGENPRTTIIKWNGADTGFMFDFNDTAGTLVMRNIWLDGNGKDITLIRFGTKQFTHCIFENVWFWDAKYGLDGGTNSPGNGLEESEFRECKFAYNYKGILITEQGLRFYSCIFAYNNYSIALYSSSQASFYGCTFTSEYWRPIQIVSNGDYPNSFLFSGCWFENSQKGIIEAPPSVISLGGLHFENCRFHTYSTDYLMTFANLNTTILFTNCYVPSATSSSLIYTFSYNRIIFISSSTLMANITGNGLIITDYRNYGQAVITSGDTSVTVSHNLGYTPTIVVVTPSEDIGDVWVGSITSTSFTIHCDTAPSSNVTVYWYAEYKP
ncbi:MAG: hypothetical protein DRJ03_31750 [Chloroflexi bacterium]|nr:MAG: hypothetical protein DRJ03_31750 [Chloroflexota bacterium]RLI53787.1 MAG: hypothetical protein DRP09_14850 [Candidatus Thorarchaeota archaeon]